MKFDEIRIRVEDPEKMRYDTAGDWQMLPIGPRQSKDTLVITVAKQLDGRMTMAVILHELAEAMLCADRGITDETVDKFDFQAKTDDPGSEPGCPYAREHDLAVVVEHAFAHEAGLDWKQYNKIVGRQTYGPDRKLPDHLLVHESRPLDVWQHYCAIEGGRLSTWLDHCPKCGVPRARIHDTKIKETAT